MEAGAGGIAEASDCDTGRTTFPASTRVTFILTWSISETATNAGRTYSGLMTYRSVSRWNLDPRDCGERTLYCTAVFSTFCLLLAESLISFSELCVRLLDRCRGEMGSLGRELESTVPGIR